MKAICNVPLVENNEDDVCNSVDGSETNNDHISTNIVSDSDANVHAKDRLTLCEKREKPENRICDNRCKENKIENGDGDRKSDGDAVVLRSQSSEACQEHVDSVNSVSLDTGSVNNKAGISRRDEKDTGSVNTRAGICSRNNEEEMECSETGDSVCDTQGSYGHVNSESQGCDNSRLCEGTVSVNHRRLCDNNAAVKSQESAAVVKDEVMEVDCDTTVEKQQPTVSADSVTTSESHHVGSELAPAVSSCQVVANRPRVQFTVAGEREDAGKGEEEQEDENPRDLMEVVNKMKHEGYKSVVSHCSSYLKNNLLITLREKA